MTEKETIQNKSEILFIYESTYSIPNGDPFTGEQRYDEETKKALVSDVRIKRFIRDYFIEHKNTEECEIYVCNELSQAEGNHSGSAARVKALKAKFKDDSTIKTKKGIDAQKLLCKCIDVRLFGGISTEGGDAANLTGPVQFALLNPSLNEVELRMHQNTSVFVSDVEKKTRGAIGTTTVVPYSVNQIHGWVNPFSAKYTGLTNEDLKLMFQALWSSINNANTRTKSNQNSLLLLQIEYTKPTHKIYGVDRLIKIETKDNKCGEQLRSIEDYKFDFSGLQSAVNNKFISKVRYHCEIEDIRKTLVEIKKDAGTQSIEKFEDMALFPENSEQEAKK